MLLLPFSAYSETQNGVSANAAANGARSWDMEVILPPETGLSVNFIRYRYTVDKQREDDFAVTISNDNALDVGKIFSETDDWSGKSGATIDKGLPVANIPRELWGRGSIETTGEGEVTDADIRYSYRFDDCINPTANPLCPQPEEGPNPLDLIPPQEDPFESDEVKDALAKEYEEDEEEKQAKEEDTELTKEDKRRKLASDVNPLMIDAARLSALFDQLALKPEFDNYYAVVMDGKVYEETIELKDATLNDNRRGFKSLAEDRKFNEIIRSQYDR